MKCNLKKPIQFKGASEMPHCTYSSASMHWNATGTWRYLRPGYIQQIPACQASCPAAEPIEIWLREFEAGRTEKAWDALTTENPFPGLMGRVCFHPCERSCNRKDVGGAVTINMLERHLADEHGYDKIKLKPWAKSSGKKIAVIGSGPAGLGNAYFSAMLGHNVTVFEKLPKPGGLFRYGIPEYRLPKAILEKELKKLYDMGINFQCDRALSKKDIEGIHEKFDAVFIATGAGVSQPLGIEGETSEGVMPALAFLKDVQLSLEGDHALDSRFHGNDRLRGGITIIIGGGNSAVDSARTAIRLGAKDVTILYRRSRAEMPAFEDEVNDAVSEGVKLEILSSPKRIITENGRVKALECVKMELGKPDESGRRSPVPVKGSEYTIPADLVLTAIGELPEKELPAKSSKIYLGGDIVNRSRTVVDAISSGKLSAIEIDCVLNGRNFQEIFEKIRIPETTAVRMATYVELCGVASQTKVPAKGGSASGGCYSKDKIVRTENLNTYYFDRSNPAAYPKKPVNARLSPNPMEEVHTSPDKNMAKAQIERCMHCGHCTECDNCFIYCPDVSILKREGGYDIDLDFCKGCGVCVKECPRSAMEMVEELAG